jgi:hypothetical protein
MKLRLATGSEAAVFAGEYLAVIVEAAFALSTRGSIIGA